MKYLEVNLSATNIVGLIIILIALVAMLAAKKFAEIFADKKYGNIADVKSFRDESDEIAAVENSAKRKRYENKVFLFFKLLALVLVIVAGLIVFLIK